MKDRLIAGDCLFPDNKATGAYRKGCRCRRCKDAQNVWQKNYHKRHPKKAIQYLRRRKFGLEPQDYDNLLKKQNGVCTICGKTNKNKRPLAVDHNHKTEQIRGLLCDKCNTAIGLLDDNIETCLSVVEYLRGRDG